MWFSLCTDYCTILATSLRGQLTLIDALFLMVVGNLAGLSRYRRDRSFPFHCIIGIDGRLRPDTGSGMVFATISHEYQAFTMLLTGLFAIIYMSVTNKTKRVKQ